MPIDPVLPGVRPAAPERVPAARAGPASRTTLDSIPDLGYVLEHRVHAGPRSTVWRARDRAGRLVALKIPVDCDPGGAAAIALRSEHRLLAGLEHPAIVRAVALIDQPPVVALVTEYLPAGDLVSLAGAAPRHWLPAVLSVLDALDYLHVRGIGHRDVKARNVRLDAAGAAHLIDFGSAARIGAPRTEAGTTTAHRWPGAARVAPADDIYALAVLIHELLTGHLPSVRGAVAAVAAVAAVGGAPTASLEPLLRRTLAAQSANAVGSIAAYRVVIESLLSVSAEPYRESDQRSTPRR
jgi:serine/threonine protein kinase